MNLLYQVLGVPFGWVVWAIYQVISNYGIAIIIFTIFVKIAQFPLGIKQHKSSIKSGIMQPKILEINKKYAKDPKKRQEETVKLQQEYGYSAQAGCLPTLIQFVVLFGVIDVVYKPLTHILRLSSDVIEKAAEAVGMGSSIGSLNYQLGVVSKIQDNPGNFVGELGQDVVNKITSLDLNFFGLDLGDQPNFTWPLIMIPILACIFSFLQMFISQKLNPMGAQAGTGSMSLKVMMYVMPLFSLWITFSVPAGVGMYWMMSYLLGIAQSVILYKMYDPKKLREQALLELEERRKSSKKAVVRTKEVTDDGKKIVKEETVSQKEANRRRLAAARKADAEKYGEEYLDVTDEDLK